MKPVFFLSRFRKSASVLAAALLLSFGSAMANPIIEIITDPADQAVTVNYLGATEDNFVFRLEYDNKLAEKCWLIIKNDVGDVVYQQGFKDLHFTRVIHLPKGEGAIHPTFVIRTSKTQIERRFEVNRQLTEAYIVTKL